MKKRLTLLVLAMALLCAGFTGCAHRITESDIAGKTYVYEKDGFGGDFTIKINSDGTFIYSEGFLSSYIGVGKWTLDGGELVLTDDKDTGRPLENRFKVANGELVFQAEASSNFTHIKAADGEKFSA